MRKKILLLLFLCSFSWSLEPKIGDIVITDYFIARQVYVKITDIKYVGKSSYTGFLIWAKSLDGKDSLVRIDSYWILPNK